MIRYYRYYNRQARKFGVVFAVCDKHTANIVTPSTCWLEEVAVTKGPKGLACEYCIAEHDWSKGKAR